MNLRFVPQNRQVQSQTITAQVIQSIKLLQCSHVELEAFISEEAERNPLIELSGPAGRSSVSLPQPDGSDRHAGADEGSAAWKGPEQVFHGKGTASGPTGSSSWQGGGSGQFGSHPDLEAYVAAGTTLSDHLHRQLGTAFQDPADLMVATEIIGSLDDDGYLRRDAVLIADALSTTESRVEAVLEKVQRMDPAGIGARDLSECLRLQLEDRDRLTPAMSRLLDHLPLLAEYDYRKLAGICGVDVDEVLAMAREIRVLDPRPGLRFDCQPVVPALPEVLVELQDDGTFVTELNARLLPRVLVNRQYYSEIRSRCRGGDETRFVTDCIKTANWLVRNLDQRAQTILKVATEVVARQRDFLLLGVEHLKPLNLKDVADAVGIHQSTVCRAISSKYMMTNRGMFELKFFFANSVSATDGNESLSADTVRHRIRQLISSEAADEILSDDAIVKELRDGGVDIARRTVAKYREGMHIPSSLQRRRQKRALLDAAASGRQVDQGQIGSGTRVASHPAAQSA